MVSCFTCFFFGFVFYWVTGLFDSGLQITAGKSGAPFLPNNINKNERKRVYMIQEVNWRTQERFSDFRKYRGICYVSVVWKMIRGSLSVFEINFYNKI